MAFTRDLKISGIHFRKLLSNSGLEKNEALARGRRLSYVTQRRDVFDKFKKSIRMCVHT